MTTWSDLAQSRYLSLTTFRRNGMPVATPVWLAPDGDDLVVITGADSGKAKRLRNNPAVLLAPCDSRGRLKGSQIDGQALLEDESGTERIRSLIESRYGWQYRAISLLERVRRQQGTQVGIRISSPPVDAQS